MKRRPARPRNIHAPLQNESAFFKSGWKVSRQTFGALMRLRFREVGFKRLYRDVQAGRKSAELLIAVIFIRSFASNKLTDLMMESGFRQIVNEALAKGDIEFLISIGRELAHAKQTPAKQAAMGSKLEWFLISFWDGSLRTRGNRGPLLNRLGRTNLAIVCSQYLQNKNLTVDAIEKTRVRLGLKPAKDKKLKLTMINGRRELDKIRM